VCCHSTEHRFTLEFHVVKLCAECLVSEFVHGLPLLEETVCQCDETVSCFAVGGNLIQNLKGYFVWRHNWHTTLKLLENKVAAVVWRLQRRPPPGFPH